MSDYLELSITGVDGSHWDISGPNAGAQGVELLPKSKQLLSDTPAKTFWIKSGGGSQLFQGFNYERRDPMSGFFIQGDTSDEWRDIDSRFRMALGNYNDQFTCNAVTQPDGQLRQLKIRLLQQPTSWESGDWEGKDNHLYNASTITVDGACETPHWVGATDSASFVWTAGSASDSGTVLMPGNPGDVPIFPRYTIDAPGQWTIADFSWGQEADFQRDPGQDATKTVLVPGGSALVSGENSKVDTNTNRPYLVAFNKAPVWMRNRGLEAIYPIAPHTPAQLVPVGVTGAFAGATITGYFDRWYTRAWGVST